MVALISRSCPDCGVVLEPKILYSNSGCYVGTTCNCGPFSRDTGYFRTHEEAQLALNLSRRTLQGRRL